MMDQRQNVYPTNLTELLAVSSYQQNVARLSLADGEINADNYADTDRYVENLDRNSTSPVSTIEDGDSSRSAFGVDLTGKGTNLAGKSFTIAAILGLTNSEEDVMNISVQERLEQNQRQLQSYLYAGHDMHRLNDDFCRNMLVPQGLRQDNERNDIGKATAAENEQLPEDQAEAAADNEDLEEIIDSSTKEDLQKPIDSPALDKEILEALGESTAEGPKFGPKIQENLARLWSPILLKGLGSKEVKEKIVKPYLIPENCPLLRAPKLNPEISAALSDASRFRDKRVESVQQQLGYGITAINRALTLLIEGGESKIEAIKLLSDSCRILCDIHHGETQARKKFITPGLDKSFLNVIQDVDHDDTLFGNKLSEKIKASKVIEKQGLQIKKVPPAPKPLTSQAATSRPHPQLNWVAPPRYPQLKGGRGGGKKTAAAGTASRKPAPPSQFKTFSSKNHRATAHRQ